MNFHPGEFINNLYYMGVGMLGVAAVIVVIIVFTMLLNWLTREKNEDTDKE